MNRIALKALLGSFLLLILNVSAFADAKIDPQLRDFVKSGTQELKKVLVIMESPSQAGEIPQRYDRRGVLSYLHAKAQSSFKRVVQSLKENGLKDGQVRKARVYYINNSFSALVTQEGLKLLAHTTGVKKIFDGTREIHFDPPVERHRRTQQQPSGAKLPYDFAEIGLDKLMAEAPGLTGEGVVLGSVDTGVDGKHPALEGKILKFFNGETKKTGEPVDFDSHGTHTVGTMIGGDRKDNLFGMAPGAKMIAAGVLIDYDTMIAGMQFMLDPDGDPSTNDMPRAINNSWNSGGAPDQEPFYKAIAAWEAVAILPVFSAGNAGPGSGTITHPHEHPSTFAIGATGPDGKIANFSSRGPGKYKGKDTKKPDITAPGVSIRSSVPNGGYENMSGTSMAAPHATGVVALLVQLDPKLTPEQLRIILIKTAKPTKLEDDESGDGDDWNATYGYGKLDIYAAAKTVKKLLQREMAMFNPTDMISSLFTTAEDTEADMLLASEPVQADLEFPAELEGSDWLSSSDFWK